MTARNYKGGTNLVVRNAENNQEIATADIQGGGVWRLFKIPENVNRIKVQFYLIMIFRQITKEFFNYKMVIDTTHLLTLSGFIQVTPIRKI